MYHLNNPPKELEFVIKRNEPDNALIDREVKITAGNGECFFGVYKGITTNNQAVLLPHLHSRPHLNNGRKKADCLIMEEPQFVNYSSIICVTPLEKGTLNRLLNESKIPFEKED